MEIKKVEINGIERHAVIHNGEIEMLLNDEEVREIENIVEE
jgi:hypothetical protein